MFSCGFFFYLITVAEFNWLLVNSCSEIVQRASFAYKSKGINFFRKLFSAWLVISERQCLVSDHLGGCGLLKYSS